MNQEDLVDLSGNGNRNKSCVYYEKVCIRLPP